MVTAIMRVDEVPLACCPGTGLLEAELLCAAMQVAVISAIYVIFPPPNANHQLYSMTEKKTGEIC
jgi:hypothetical protein